MHLRPLACLTLSLLIPCLVHAAPAAPSSEPAAQQVAIQAFQFHPARLVVPVGTTVTWINHDEEPHLVASTDGGFRNSPALDTGDRYSTRFRKPGTYTYFCSIHPQMVGTIVVR